MSVVDDAVAAPLTQHHVVTVARPRQDALRRVCVAGVDTVAALVTAATLAFSSGTLPIQIALLVPMCWILMSWAVGGYHSRRLASRLIDVRSIVLTAGGLWAGAGLLAQLSPLPGTRSLVLFVVPTTAVAVFVARALLTPLMHRGRLLATAPVIAVGSSFAVQQILAASSRGDQTTPTVAGACLLDEPVSYSEFAGMAVTDRIADLADLVRRTGADTVVVTDGVDSEQLRRISWQLEPLGAAVAVAPLWTVAPHRVNVRRLGDATMVEVSPPRYHGTRPMLRELVDRVLAVVAVILLSPLLIGAAIAIKVTSPGPVFFAQQRTGHNGRRFRLWKFRTMVPDAERLKSTLVTANQYQSGTLFKMKDDPRITPVGRWLRRFSIDELPQLLNVIRGDMVLVGPRPTSAHPDTMPADYRRRTHVKPGLTGLWQVSGRSDLPWEEAVRLDLHYVENRSIDMDLDILFRRTLPAVLNRTGAY